MKVRYGCGLRPDISKLRQKRNNYLEAQWTSLDLIVTCDGTTYLKYQVTVREHGNSTVHSFTLRPHGSVVCLSGLKQLRLGTQTAD